MLGEYGLRIRGLSTGYGKRRVLGDIDLDVEHGEILSVIGHNGAGKSTLLRAVFGLVPLWSGSVTVGGVSLPSLPQLLLRAGVVYVPQGGRVFKDLSVRENLAVAGSTLPTTASVNDGIQRSLGFFPMLVPRLRGPARNLSGGEKQLLALASCLVLRPRVLLLDEPCLGLAPGLAREVLRLVQEINTSCGATVVIVEQRVREVLKIAARTLVLRNGATSFIGTASELSNDEDRLRRVYL